MSARTSSSRKTPSASRKRRPSVKDVTENGLHAVESVVNDTDLLTKKRNKVTSADNSTLATWCYLWIAISSVVVIW